MASLALYPTPVVLAGQPRLLETVLTSGTVKRVRLEPRVPKVGARQAQNLTFELVKGAGLPHRPPIPLGQREVQLQQKADRAVAKRRCLSVLLV